MTKVRKSCTGGVRCEPRNLAESVYCAVHHSAIDARTIAERIGVRVGYLLDAANPDRDDMQFQSRHLIPLMTVTGNMLPLKFIAVQMCCLIVLTRWIDTELDAWIAARAAERTQLAPSAPVSPTPTVCAEPPAQSAPRASSSEVYA